MQLQIADYKKYFGADNIKNFDTDWQSDGYWQNTLNTNSVLFLKKNATDLTVGKLVARLLTKSYTGGENSTLEAFWVDLANQDIFCYSPCPDDSGDCCSIENPFGYPTTPTPRRSEAKITENLFTRHTWLTWVSTNDDNNITLVQDYTEPYYYGSGTTRSPRDHYDYGSPDCGALYIYNDYYFRENCRAKHRPLCMKGSSIEFEDTRRKRKSHKKKKTRKIKKKKDTKRGKRSSGRQLTDTGRPIEMCATVLPALIGNNNNNRI